jgi:hypothetical protein
MAKPARTTIVQTYPLPGDGKVSLTVLSEGQLTGEDYRLLSECVETVQRFAEAVRQRSIIRAVPDFDEDPTEITIVDADE